MVGRLIYLTITRPDISYIFSLVMHAPRTNHLLAVHRIMRYLKGSLGQGILYNYHGHAKAMAYIDANWVGSLTNRKSTKDIVQWLEEI